MLVKTSQHVIAFELQSFIFYSSKGLNFAQAQAITISYLRAVVLFTTIVLQCGSAASAGRWKYSYLAPAVRSLGVNFIMSRSC